MLATKESSSSVTNVFGTPGPVQHSVRNDATQSIRIMQMRSAERGCSEYNLSNEQRKKDLIVLK
jgi:hypothetical protein